MNPREAITRKVHALLEREARINLHRHPLDAAASVEGVDGIVDRLRVAPGERRGDGAIRDSLARGHVISHSHRRFAGVLAWWTPGQRDVVNSLDVRPDYADRDEDGVPGQDRHPRGQRPHRGAEASRRARRLGALRRQARDQPPRSHGLRGSSSISAICSLNSRIRSCQ